jgi:uncharacterized SAM-binding protein YcdF (DUF218 family)
LIFWVSKLFTALFLPPGLFVTLLAAAAVRCRSLCRYALAGAAVLIYLLSIRVVAENLLEPLEKPYRHFTPPDRVEAVIMLGGGIYEGVPNLMLSQQAFKRALWALKWADSYRVPLIVSGGARGRVSEAEAFGRMLKTLSPLLDAPPRLSSFVPRYGWLAESQALDTRGNAKRVCALLPQSATVALVTSAYHMRRAMRYFKQECPSVRTVPFATDFVVENRPYDLLDWLPKLEMLNRSYRALHEYFGLLKILLLRS